MKLKRMTLRGRFVEAFLYYDFLWLVDAEGNVSAFDLLRFWEGRSGPEAVAGRCVFARNDELVQGQGNVARYDQQVVPVRAFLDAPDVTLEAGDVERNSIAFDARIDAGSVLDMRCYYGRAFVATERGISQFKLHDRQALLHMGVGTRGNGRLGGQVVHGGKCVQFRSRYGVVSASCGRDGAFYAKGASSDDPAWKSDFVKFAGWSKATEFVGTTVTNVGRGLELEFYETELHGRASDVVEGPDGQTDPGEITGIGGLREATVQANASIRDEQTRRSVSFTRTFLTSGSLFALDASNTLQRFSLVRGGELTVPAAKAPFSAAPDDVIGMTTCPMGIVAEMVGSVSFLRDGEWHTLKDEAVFSVRGYPASKWYRNLLTVVGEEAVDVVFASA